MPMQLTYHHIVKGQLILIFSNTNKKNVIFGTIHRNIKISTAKNGHLKVSKLELIKHIPYAHPVADHGLSKLCAVISV